MQLFPPERPIDIYNEGFGEEDPLGRREAGEYISQLVDQIEDPIVIALDGAWGCGKTYFLRRWVGAHKVENNGRATTVYFDAFAHDFLEDPLVALTGAIGGRLDERSKGKTWDKVKTAAARLARPITRIGLAASTSGASELVGVVGDAALEAGRAEVEKATEEFWRREDGRRAAMDDLRRALIELTKIRTSGNETRPLVVVVDELDRCRPDYALAMLEVIKHFFAVPNLHFVLGVNLEALQNSVRARYGSGIDAEAYLGRFVTIRIQLPDSIRAQGEDSVGLAYFDLASSEMNIPQKLKGPFRTHLGIILKSKQIAIRDIRMILARMVLLPSKPQFERLPWGWRQQIVSLTILRVLDYRLYGLCVSGNEDINKISEFYGNSGEYLRGERREDYSEERRRIIEVWDWIISDGAKPNAEKADLLRKEFFETYGPVHSPRHFPRWISKSFIEKYDFVEAD